MYFFVIVFVNFLKKNTTTTM